jgi:hypothetical protein
LRLCHVEESAGLRLCLEYLCLCTAISLVNSDVFGDACLFHFGLLFNFVLVSLGLSQKNALLGHFCLLDRIFIVIGEVDGSELEELDPRVEVSLEAEVQILPHLLRDAGTHNEEIIGSEAGWGITNGINGHSQQDILHFITVLSVDFIDFLRDNTVLEGYFK